MVQEFNKKEDTFTVKFKGDVEDLHHYQTAIIELLKNYNFGNYADESTIYNALDLLLELLPDIDVMKRGFETVGDYLIIPENLSEKRKRELREAVTMIENPGLVFRKEKNPIFELLNTPEN